MFARVGAFAQGVGDLDAAFGSESKILAYVPPIGFTKTAALFYDSLHAPYPIRAAGMHQTDLLLLAQVSGAGLLFGQEFIDRNVTDFVVRGLALIVAA